MQTNRLRLVAFGIAVSLNPTLLRAQDPATVLGSPAQSRQIQPGASSGSLPSSQQDSSPSPGFTGQEMQDKMFLRKAAQGGIAEVKLGRLAAEKGRSEEVKSFGARMVSDHTMLNNEMKATADSFGVRLPRDLNKMDQAEFDKLSSLTGDSFDKEYVTFMVEDHRRDLREFHAEAANTQDASLQAEVRKAEGVIRQHAQMITTIAKTKGIMIQPGDSSTQPALPIH